MTTAIDTPEISDSVRELLTVLAEECGETVQRCTKILRFGLRVNPWTGKHNRETLERELGDIFAIMSLLQREGVIDGNRVTQYAMDKVEALAADPDRLRYTSVSGS